ncbi:MAG: hypothetical protein RL097_78 [Candidatus Parcubacteria bacterium]|jgi:poly-gamma-glutamate synthesis protein (capsule biosynthesis protein)
MQQQTSTQFFTFILSITLLVQLSTIEISFTIPSHSYGSAVFVAVADELATPTPSANSDVMLAVGREESNSLIFVGDVLLARNVEILSQRYGATYPFDGLKFSTIAPASYIIGNFESAVPVVHEPTAAGSLRFSVDASFLPYLRQAGFTHLSLANNHSFDYGKQNFLHTRETLLAHDLAPMGHPEQISKESISFLTVNHKVVALLTIHTLAQMPTISEIETMVSYASKRSDIQITYVHWGTEYEPVNNTSQRDLAEVLVKAGVDLIVGHHPHVVQNVDVIDGVPVFYSLGNYIFDQYFSPETQEGLVLQLDVSDDPILYLHPVTSEASLSQPRTMTAAHHVRFLHSLASRSSGEIAPSIRRGFLPMDSLVASSSKIAMIVR